MRTVSSRVNEEEFEAISEYANQTGETVSNVLKKAVFERAAKSKDGCPEGYRLNRRVHQGMDKEASLSKDVDIIRKVLGWDEQAAPADKPKVTLESYANYLRKKEGNEKLVKQIQDALKKPMEELQEDVDELKGRLSS